MRQLINPRSYAPPLRLLAKRHISFGTRQAALRNTVDEIDARLDIAQFRRITRAAEDRLKAVVFRRQAQPGAFLRPDSIVKQPVVLPALAKWFIRDQQGQSMGLSRHFKQFKPSIVPYELVFGEGGLPGEADDSAVAFRDWLREKSPHLLKRRLSQVLARHETGDEQLDAYTDFVRFDAPLGLLDAALQYNSSLELRGHLKPVSQLYIAQASLSDLPQDLQLDVPTPQALVAPPTPQVPYTADIYDSSLWLGLEPTFTPWHRDPNHNLFCQLCGSKTVRLLPPEAGARLFKKVMSRLGSTGDNVAIRGVEMMRGAERQAWQDGIWGPDAPPFILETVVHPRDVMFIPKGWWHSVKSTGGGEGTLNASVNWWFRWRDPSTRTFNGGANTDPSASLGGGS
ncbi:hypothetical protein C8A01DRAFT_50588 [Parachaetomium inaequale]|uniref:JmjC domain-containing protein n=1 Tax=Parachaetomium inaequale TaxID=2588326 RepID=A0AAN6P6H9_9PEZI|nr:hypothetical protein C8A01DRAFT_50588 [Parachaetomium inaequale]